MTDGNSSDRPRPAPGTDDPEEGARHLPPLGHRHGGARDDHPQEAR
jgi:hypothetical protein